MGQFRSTYVSPHAQSIAARIRVAPAAAKATSPSPALEQVVPVERVLIKHAVAASVPKLEAAPTNPRESRVSHATVKDPTAATRRARWRKKNPEQHRVQQRAARARRKASS